MADSFQPDSFIPDSFAPDNSETPKFTQGMFKTYKGKPEGVLQKADAALGKAGNVAMDVMNAPFEALDPVTALIEGRPAQPVSLLGGQPANPFSTINKLLRAGGGALAGVPSGNPMDAARAAYNAPRGGMGTVEDTAMALLLGKVAPEAVAAPVDTAVAGVSKGAELAGAGLKKLAGGVGKLATGATRKGIRLALGPSEEAQSVLASRPQDVARQTDFNDLSTKLADTVHGLRDKISELDNQAWDTLLKLKAEPQSKIISILKNVKQEFIGKGGTKISDSDRQAVAQIDKYIERVTKIKQPGANPGAAQFLDQPQLKELIQSIQKDATYGLVKNEPVNRAVMAVRKGIDQYLKIANPKYEEAMKPVAEATSALEQAIKTFRLEKDANGNLVPSKTTLTNLQSATKSKNPAVGRTIEQLKNVTGIDFADEAKLTAIKQEFAPGAKAQGSRRVQMGRAIGGGLGTLVGSATGHLLPAIEGGGAGTFLGGVLGGASDYYGGPMAQKIIEALSGTKSGVGNVLSAVNSRIQGTPLQEIIQQISQQQPVLLPLLKGSR